MPRMTYEQWLIEVNRILSLRQGLDTDVMTDQPWHDWYDAGVSPLQAVQRALANDSY